MIPQELIKKKRDGLSLSNGELEEFFSGFLKGEVADYQVSAMLMAIFLRGMTDEEIVFLTKLSRDSGQVFSWSQGAGTVVDKHSTGGVGDKTSLLILPLCLLEGLRVPMIAGRGLGHTGGTVDKLNSIPGMNMELSTEQCDQQMKDLGGFFLGQTKDIAALDRELYRLRDVTATVESIPLILVSILSKKLAEGLSGLVMDVKFGSGAFMEDYGQAEVLAQGLVDVAGKCGLSLRAVLSSMSSPLGTYAGNSLEVWECLEIMRGEGPQDTVDLTLELTAQMVQIAKPSENIDEIKKRLSGYFSDGSCYEMFCKVVARQGGDISFFEKKENFYNAKIIEPVFADGSAKFVQSIDVRSLGLSVVALGGGRKKISDEINPRVGLSQLLRVGAEVGSKEPIAYVHADSQEDFEQAASMVRAAYHMGDQAKAEPLVKKILS